MQRLRKRKRSFHLVGRLSLDQRSEPLDRARALSQPMLDDALQEIELCIVRRDSQPALSRIARASKTTSRDHRPRKSRVTVGISRITRNKFLAKQHRVREALLRKKNLQLGEFCGLNRSCRLHFLKPNTEPKGLGSRKRTYIRVIGDRHHARPRQKDSTTLHGFSRCVRGRYACPRLRLSSIASRATRPGDIHGDFEVFQIVCVAPAATG